MNKFLVALLLAASLPLNAHAQAVCSTRDEITTLLTQAEDTLRRPLERSRSYQQYADQLACYLNAYLGGAGRGISVKEQADYSRRYLLALESSITLNPANAVAVHSFATGVLDLTHQSRDYIRYVEGTGELRVSDLVIEARASVSRSTGVLNREILLERLVTPDASVGVGTTD